jgi:hypothetical protein
VVQELKVLLRVATKHPQKVELLALSTMFLTFLLIKRFTNGQALDLETTRAS